MQEDLETVHDILKQLKTFNLDIEKDLPKETGSEKSKLLVDTSGSEPGTSTSSPAGFPQQGGLITSPVESVRSSLDVAESLVVEVAETSRTGWTDFEDEDGSPGNPSLLPDGSDSSSIHGGDAPDPQIFQTDERFIQEERVEGVKDEIDYFSDFDGPTYSPIRSPPPGSPVGTDPQIPQTEGSIHGGDESDSERTDADKRPIQEERMNTMGEIRNQLADDSDFDGPVYPSVNSPPPGPPAIGPPIATSTPIKTSIGRTCKNMAARELYLKKSDTAAPKKKKTRRQKRDTSLIRKTRPAKKARLANESGIADDSDSGHDEHQGSVVHSNRMSPIQNELEVDQDPHIPIENNDFDRPQNQEGVEVDEMADDHYYLHRMENDEGAPDWTPAQSPLPANQADVQVDEMADNPYNLLHVENDVGAPDWTPPRSPFPAIQVDDSFHVDNDRAPFRSPGRPFVVEKTGHEVDEMADSTNSPKMDNHDYVLGDSGFSETRTEPSGEASSSSLEGMDEEKVAEHKMEKLANPFHRFMGEPAVKVPFSSILTTNKTRKEAAFSFYTLLYMAKNQQIEVKQAEPFGEIEITKKSTPGDNQ